MIETISSLKETKPPISENTCILLYLLKKPVAILATGKYLPILRSRARVQNTASALIILITESLSSIDFFDEQL